MKLHFYKYQATGNDFVLIDNRSGVYAFDKTQIERICHRRFGVGADGFMLIEKHPELDFNLVYYNRDGSQSLCGNGSRAAVHLASALGMANGRVRFQAHDGMHEAEILSNGEIRLKMNDVTEVRKIGDDFFVNTGSPHFIRFVNDIHTYPVFGEGRKIRYSDACKPGGTNVNFVGKLGPDTLFVRTYERGVEDETLSCGTGVTAVALAASLSGYPSPVFIKTPGGDLTVEFKPGQSGSFTDIFLTGPAKMVFKGELEPELITL